MHRSFVLYKYITFNSYDFGLRAIKPVLLAAGAHKLQASSNDDMEEEMTPKAAEEALLVRALLDCNIPKLLAEDIALFKGIQHYFGWLLILTGIIADIFIGNSAVPLGDNVLVPALTSTAKELRLVPFPDFIEKCKQLYDTLSVRHGVMLVGETMSGKTTCIQPIIFTN